MSDTRTGDRAVFFLLGAAIGGAAALLMAPASGVHTRRRLRRQGEEVADYLIHTGKELVDKCEDLYERSGEVVEDATQELSGKYRATDGDQNTHTGFGVYQSQPTMPPCFHAGDAGEGRLCM